MSDNKMPLWIAEGLQDARVALLQAQKSACHTLAVIEGEAQLLVDEMDALKKTNALLLAALGPFAAMIFTAMYEHASDETVVYATETRAGHFEITVGDFRRARTAIQAATAKGGAE